MLTHPTLDQLNQLGLFGMAKAFGEADDLGRGGGAHPSGMAGPAARPGDDLPARQEARRQASLCQAAPAGARRGCRLPRRARSRSAAVPEARDGDWIDAHDNLIILSGPTGVGKSWLACALGHKACRDNRSVLYQRVPKLFGDLALARGDGRYARLSRALGGVQLLILDDWGLEPLDAQARHDLLEILEERYGRRSTIITSQLPVDDWHAVIGDPTYADAILDRLVHNAHRLNLSGDSLRRTREKPAKRVDHQRAVPPITSQRGPRPGRHHVGILGAIISECLGDFVGIRTRHAAGLPAPAR